MLKNQMALTLSIRIVIKRVLFFCSLVVLFSCSESNEVRTGKIEIFDGSQLEAKAVNIDGWEILTSDEGTFISLSKNGSGILYITEDGFGGIKGFGRTITIDSKTRGHRVEITDEDLDTNYDLMEIHTREKTFSDKGLDGVLDMVTNWDTFESKVNYAGKLYPVNEDGEKRSIEVDGKKIKLERKGLIWVPNEKTYNKKGDDETIKGEPQTPFNSNRK